ncbi:MAG: ABC transporter permease, partial [Hydrogenobacter sp.]
KLNFPRELIPLSSVINHSLHFLLSVPVILIFAYLYNKSPAWWLPLGLVLVFIPQFLLSYGISLAVSSLHLFFRDLDRLVSILLTLIFYMTPIVYSEDMVPENYRYMIYLNPIALLVMCWRRLFFGQPLEMSFVLLSLFYSSIIFLAGYGLFKKLSWRFAEVL